MQRIKHVSRACVCDANEMQQFFQKKHCDAMHQNALNLTHVDAMHNGLTCTFMSMY